MSMPPLPEPRSIFGQDFTRTQMKEYALSVLEAAAKVCEEKGEKWGEGCGCAAAIRDLKE